MKTINLCHRFMARYIQRTLAAAALCSVPFVAGAVPARSVWHTYSQTDGTELLLMLKGDEAFHYFETEDGLPVCQDGENGFYYAILKDGRLMPSTVLAHSVALRSVDEVDYVNANVLQTQQLNEVRRVNRQMPSNLRKLAAKSTKTRGENQKFKQLAILVQFPDKKFTLSNPVATFSAFMNDENYKEHNQHGSVRDYFLAQSGGVFDMQVDVVGPVTLSQRMSYYGANDSEGFDKRPHEMVAEACKGVDDVVNFAQYDNDGDGMVENVCIIYAGYCEANGAPSTTIWPHRWFLSDPLCYGEPLTFDGVQVNSYICSNELSDTSGNKMEGIGTFCHEYSHSLGLPDFYDTKGVNFGLSSWSIMDGGCLNNGGYCPCGYTALEKWMLGWSEPDDLLADEDGVVLKALSEDGNSRIIYNDNYEDEYYILENRQQTGWDTYLKGHGMMVMHVVYDQEVWSNNEINDTFGHQLVEYIPADNTSTKGSLASDPFPGTRNVTQLLYNSTPVMKLYHPTKDGSNRLMVSMQNITETNGIIRFDFKNMTTGIDDVKGEPQEDAITVYDINGMKLPYTQLSSLPKGTYIVCQNGQRRKYTVR